MTGYTRGAWALVTAARTVMAAYRDRCHGRGGRVSGRGLVESRGTAHFAALGRVGGAANRATHSDEHFARIGTAGGEKLARTRGVDYYRRIGAKGLASRYGTGVSDDD